MHIIPWLDITAFPILNKTCFRKKSPIPDSLVSLFVVRQEATKFAGIFHQDAKKLLIHLKVDRHWRSISIEPTTIQLTIRNMLNRVHIRSPLKSIKTTTVLNFSNCPIVRQLLICPFLMFTTITAGCWTEWPESEKRDLLYVWFSPGGWVNCSFIK